MTKVGYKTWAAILLISGLCLYPFDIRRDKLFWNELFNAGHFGLLCLVTLWLYLILARDERTNNFRLCLTFALGSAVAIAIEGLQPLFGRDQSIPDVIHGALGSLGGAIRGAACTKRRRIVLTSVAVLLSQLALFYPAFLAWKTLGWRDGHYPLLGSFEEQSEMLLWRPVDEESILQIGRGPDGNRVLSIKGGVEYRGGETNFTGYATLSFEVFSAHRDTLELAVRIDDYKDCREYQDRFNKRLSIAPGWNEVRIPVVEIQHGPSNRLLELDSIRRILIFVPQEEAKKTWLLDNLRLIN